MFLPVFMVGTRSPGAAGNAGDDSFEFVEFGAAVSGGVARPPARAAQIAALSAVDEWLGAGGPPPSVRAAEAVWKSALRNRGEEA